VVQPCRAKTATSYYDTTPLRDTLLELVDFDLINARKTHFAVGARQCRHREFPVLRQQRKKSSDLSM